MEDNLMKKNMWNGASIAGLALGGLSTVYLFATQLISEAELSAFLNMMLISLLWVCKFGGCIWLMMFFMKKFAAENTKVDNRHTRRFGIIASFLSAIVYAAASFANVAFISAEMFEEQTGLMLQQMAPMMDSNSMAMLDKYLENLPQYTFFANLIYCFIYGAVLSAILSSNIPSRDPFADYKPDEQ